ncbi:MAG: UvrD-helicase domain-containing protein [Acidimicrobiales bacterium]
MTSRSAFSIADRLPTGRVAIEASAGTGKTYTLAGLVVRYVAENAVPIERLLIVTFTRAAAAELRDRVRTALTQAAAALREPAQIAADDLLMQTVAAEDRTNRIERLEQAIIDYDGATITTIHGFATQVLTTLGSAAPGDLDATLLDDTSEVVRTVCTDVLATAALREPSTSDQLPGLEPFCRSVMKVLGNPGIVVIPSAEASESTPTAAAFRHLVDLAVAEVHFRRRLAGTLSFDDVLTQLSEALHHRQATVASLRRRFQIALIDEFQDTDPVQWDIFSTLFGEIGEGSALVLVADPKQAIYAFRGANVHTYLEAEGAPHTCRGTLGTNWRSDGVLVGALHRLFEGATFGDARIAYVPVAPSGQNRDRRLTTATGAPLPALKLRLALGPDIARTKKGQIDTELAARAIARDLASQVQDLLETAWLPDESGDRRRLRPSDIAVLVSVNAEATPIQEALRNHDIPAVVTRGDSVLESAAATQWRELLAALESPSDPRRARLAALSWFFGWSAAELDVADDTALGAVQDRIRTWAETLDERGVVEFCARIWSESGVAARVLASGDGDRNVTDLDHIAGLLQTTTRGHRPTAAGLMATLDELATEKGVDPEDDVTARQVESEAEAVQIMTAHVAKGLEFPIVCVPTMWRHGERPLQEIVFQDPETGRRTFDIANREQWPTGQAAEERKALAKKEVRGENLRLLYVALTRSKHATLAWWTSAWGSEATGLARVLFARTNGALDPDKFEGAKVKLPPDDQAVEALESVFASCGDAVSIEVVGAGNEPVRKWSDTAGRNSGPVLELAVLGQVPARTSRRWSFSLISEQDHGVVHDPQDESLGDLGVADEKPDLAEAVGPSEPYGPSDLPLGPIPGGAQFGTLVHEVLQRVDFASDGLDTELTACVDDRLGWNPWPVDPPTLVAGLRSVIDAPLGPLFGGRCLRNLSRADRLDELGFEIRLGGKGHLASDRDLGALMLKHVSKQDPLWPWAKRLQSGLFSVELGGHLTGSIDLVARVHAAGEPDAPARYVVVDYKTNRLAAPGREPQSSDYRSDRLVAAMADHHYPLQALLYSVALHRYLRWRVRGYEPAVHLGGVAYLFVRGMAGADTPVSDGNPCGVFSWPVPVALVTELSDLLDGAGKLVNRP